MLVRQDVHFLDRITFQASRLRGKEGESFAGRGSPAELLSFSVRCPKKKKSPLLIPLPLCLGASVVNLFFSSRQLFGCRTPRRVWWV
jgi:hypothetical protein